MVDEKQHPKKISKKLLAAIIASMAYAICGFWLIYYRSEDVINKGDFLDINELGDFMAGWFSPLAFMWFVATVIIQSRELRNQYEELKLNRSAMEAQVEEMKHTVRQGQFKLLAERVEKYENDYFDEKYRSWVDFSSDLTRCLKRLVESNKGFAEEVIPFPTSKVSLEDISGYLGETEELECLKVLFMMRECSEFRDKMLKVRFSADQYGASVPSPAQEYHVGYLGRYFEFEEDYPKVVKFVVDLREIVSPEIVSIDFATSQFGRKYHNLINTEMENNPTVQSVFIDTKDGEAVVAGGEPVLVTKTHN